MLTTTTMTATTIKPTKIKVISDPSEADLFKYEPEYQPPTKGVLSLFSDQWRPYAELARLDKPGFALLWIVHICGLLPAAILNQVPPRHVLGLALFFLPANQFLMLFNFAWNDTCDVEFDRKVLRTRHRPLARNALTMKQALVFDGLLAGILLAFLIPLPAACVLYALVLGLGCLVYPLTKRYTHHPQAFLGFVLAGGVYMGAAAAGVNGVPVPSRIEDILSPLLWELPATKTAIVLGGQYLAVVAWVISTEIVYSYQDAEWDEAAGVGTITRLIPGPSWAKALLVTLAGVQLLLFGVVGKLLAFDSDVWILSVGATTAALAVTISSVDLRNPDSCLMWFQLGNLATGSAMLLGFGAQYLRTI